MSDAQAWKAAVRERLKAAMKARSDADRSLWRQVLALIENAEAVEAPLVTQESSVIAGSRAGLGASEAARRALSADEVRSLLRADIAERRNAAPELERVGQETEATLLRTQAEAVEAFVGEAPV
ncbi:MAG: hypothetical protein SFW67_04990 [Myxococcaceae bacterium]|nr:hypothetical protein [Myxococcaceae bacterium]